MSLPCKCFAENFKLTIVHISPPWPPSLLRYPPSCHICGVTAIMNLRLWYCLLLYGVHFMVPVCTIHSLWWHKNASMTSAVSKY